MPTMSLEEFAEKEMADMREREAREHAMKMEMEKETEEEAEERQRIKDKNWDDWKDLHDKGIGNTKRL